MKNKKSGKNAALAEFIDAELARMRNEGYTEVRPDDMAERIRAMDSTTGFTHAPKGLNWPAEVLPPLKRAYVQSRSNQKSER